MQRALFWVVLTLAVSASATHATVLAEWTFETSQPFATDSQAAGPYAAENGANAASSFASGLHAGTATDYSNPVGNGSFESFSSNTWATGDYYQFTTNTVGYSSITIAWNQTRSSTGPTTFDLEWSTDGIAYSTLVNDYTVPSISWSSTTPDATNTTVFGPIAGPATLDNQTAIYIRITAQVTPAAGGTSRVDNVVVSGVPEPATVGLLALGGLLFARRRNG